MRVDDVASNVCQALFFGVMAGRSGYLIKIHPISKQSGAGFICTGWANSQTLVAPGYLQGV